MRGVSGDVPKVGPGVASVAAIRNRTLGWLEDPARQGPLAARSSLDCPGGQFREQEARARARKRHGGAPRGARPSIARGARGASQAPRACRSQTACSAGASQAPARRLGAPLPLVRGKGKWERGARARLSAGRRSVGCLTSEYGVARMSEATCGDRSRGQHRPRTSLRSATGESYG